jgi:hypothetical protein
MNDRPEKKDPSLISGPASSRTFEVPQSERKLEKIMFENSNGR